MSELGFSGIRAMSFKILVVEDIVDSRELLHFFLTAKGFDVATAVDGQEGFYMATLEKPDVIITDLTMPNMDGIDLMKKVRLEPEIAQTPVIVYTSFGSGSAEFALKTGANKVFYKPMGLDSMLKYIDELMRQCGKSAG
jgi:CheY-like chemotaxis protein